MAVVARTTRSGVAETEFHGHCAVADPGGDLLGWAGDPTARFYLRSSAKPLQALGIVASGAYKALGMTPKELAVCCASHCGSFEHQQTVLGLLAKAGLAQAHLQCGSHMPGDAEARNALIREGRKPTPVHNNCSGKHTGMLVTSVHLGAPVETYLELAHPVQQMILANISRLSGVPVDDIHIGVDGCGAPVHCLPLRAMATAFARAATRERMPAELGPAALAIRKAIGAHPDMVAGHGDFTTEVLRASDGDAYAKSGAEGLFCVGFESQGLGVAVKIADGSFRAMAPVVMRVLGEIGIPEKVLSKLAAYRRLPVRNCRAERVGWIEATAFML